MRTPGLVTLADLPELQGADQAPTTTITVARLGKYYDPRYGNFRITRDDYDGWQRNLSTTFGGKASIDFDHSSDRGKGTEAAAWITGLALSGDDVQATVEWTPKGATAVRNGAYKFISPTFVSKYTDEHGQERGRALLGAALTNRPVLRQLPALSLSRETVDGAATLDGRPDAKAAKRARKHARRLLAQLDAGEHPGVYWLSVSTAERNTAHAANHSLPDRSYPINNTDQLHKAAVLAASHHGNWKAAKQLIKRRAADLKVPVSSLPGMGGKGKGKPVAAASDSRAAMDLKTLAKQLGLPEDADQATILASVIQLPTEAETPAPTPVAQPTPVKLSKKQKKAAKLLAAAGANSDGTITLSAEEAAQLISNANQGQAAAVQLAEQTFENEWTKTLSDGRVAPAQEETFRSLYAKDPQLAIKTLSGLQRIVPTSPAGGGEGPGVDGINGMTAPNGWDQERLDTHLKAKARAKVLAKEQDISEDDAYVLAAMEVEDGPYNGSLI